MSEIKTQKEIRIGDDIVIDNARFEIAEGRVVNRGEDGIFANMFDLEGGVRKIRPDQIISLRRGSNYFRVAIK